MGAVGVLRVAGLAVKSGGFRGRCRLRPQCVQRGGRHGVEGGWQVLITVRAGPILGVQLAN